MGNFGIQIAGTGPGEYAHDGLGADAEAAVLDLTHKLEALGFEILATAVLTPAAPDQPALAPVKQLPVEAGPYTCPACGSSYLMPGSCEGGEYGHMPETLLPTHEVVGGPAPVDPAAVTPATYDLPTPADVTVPAPAVADPVESLPPVVAATATAELPADVPDASTGPFVPAAAAAADWPKA